MQNFQVNQNAQFAKIEKPEETGGYSTFFTMLFVDYFFYLVLWGITIAVLLIYFNVTNKMDIASNTVYLVYIGWYIILFFLIVCLVLAVFTLLLIIPTVKSINALLSPPDLGYFQRELGARNPSTYEERFIVSSLKRLSRPGVTIPTLFLILDNPEFVMSIYGNVFIVSSERIEDDDFMPYAAHELGHYNSSDAKLHLAVYLYKPLALSRLFYYSSGSWATYFRERDFLADKYAVMLGQRGQLIEALEKIKPLEAPFDEKEDEVPPAEIRIDRLRYFAR